MTPAARIAAAMEILDRIQEGESAERALTGWTRSRRFAGSKDRAALRDIVFDALRHRRSYGAFGGGTSGRALMIGALRSSGVEPETMFTGVGHAPAPLTSGEQHLGGTPPPDSSTALDCPDWLSPILQETHGTKTAAILKCLQSRASVHLRVNLRKTNLADAMARLSTESVETRLHPLSPTALEVTDGARAIRSTGSFRDGWVELQDAASQAMADCIPLREGGHMLDFCAGGGGKSLAVAARVNGRFWVHDANPRRMSDIPSRAQRAGVVLEQVDTASLPQLERFDVVLTDVPCSGSGSWRRDPEGKWLLTKTRLSELCNQQDAILISAASFVRQGGFLVYGTCSLLQQENQDRVQHFIQKTGESWQLISSRQLTPLDGADGFFWAILRKN